MIRIKKIIIGIIVFISTFFIMNINVKAEKPDLLTAGFMEHLNDIDDFDISTIEYDINGHNGVKTYMSYKAITDKTSNQYIIQEKAYTDENGFRKIEDRYCVAIGTAFNAEVGQYFMAELDNGSIIKCIVGDIKADIDTDKTNTFTSQGCCLEFIVDTKKINDIIKTTGNCSDLSNKWDSPCIKYIIYDEINYIEERSE